MGHITDYAYSQHDTISKEMHSRIATFVRCRPRRVTLGFGTRLSKHQ